MAVIWQVDQSAIPWTHDFLDGLSGSKQACWGYKSLPVQSHLRLTLRRISYKTLGDVFAAQFCAYPSWPQNSLMEMAELTISSQTCALPTLVECSSTQCFPGRRWVHSSQGSWGVSLANVPGTENIPTHKALRKIPEITDGQRHKCSVNAHWHYYIREPLLPQVSLEPSHTWP